MKPKTLYDLGLQSVLKWLDRICLVLEASYHHNCKTVMINAVKKFLHNLPVTVSEDLTIKESQFCSDHYFALRTMSLTTHLTMKWAMLAHSNLRRFGRQVKCSHYSNFEHFWPDSGILSSLLKSMSSLKELRLSIKVNNDILDAISQGCSGSLEILEVEIFKGVTNEGLQFLQNCKKLRKISSKHGKDLKDLSLEALSGLLLGCPELQFLGHFSLGKLLNYMFSQEGPVNPLKLAYFEEKEDIVNANIRIVEELCPNLRHIRLRDSLSSMNSSLWGPIFDELANSKLALEIIELWKFSCFDKFETFLQSKGSGMKSLSSCFLPESDVQHFKIIGENCPHLTHIGLFGVHLDLPFFIPKPPGEVWFNELRSVSITGSPGAISELLLEHFLLPGNKVEKLKVFFPKCAHYHEYDELMVKLLESNRLKKITDISVPMSYITSRRLIYELPSLMRILLPPWPPFPLTDFKRLQEEFKAVNISIDEGW